MNADKQSIQKDIEEVGNILLRVRKKINLCLWSQKDDELATLLDVQSEVAFEIVRKLRQAIVDSNTSELAKQLREASKSAVTPTQQESR
jgi:hypothetical protein